MTDLFSYYREQSNEIGTARQIIKSVVLIEGLPGVSPTEMIIFESGQLGYVFGINEDLIEVALLDGDIPSPGTTATRTKYPISAMLDSSIMGGQLDALGNLDLAKVSSGKTQLYPLDTSPRSVGERVSIDEQLITGINAIDLLVPLGKGQRELLIGDRVSGKSSTALQIAFTQAEQGNKVVYCSIGQRTRDIQWLTQQISASKYAENFVLVSSAARDPLGKIVMTPFTGMTVAEFIAESGEDVVVIFDDLTTHAKFYRELALHSGRFPGRESYPGDIFYTHARLLERAGKFRHSRGSVSITALPLAESISGNISGYIQTNLMSITDGHIYLDTELFYSGIRPAVNPFLSVTRVGKQTQTPLRQQLTQLAMKILDDHKTATEYSRFGADIGDQIQTKFSQGEQLWQALTQPLGMTIPYPLQSYILGQIAFTQKPLNIPELVKTYTKDKKFQATVEKLNSAKDLETFRKEIINRG